MGRPRWCGPPSVGPMRRPEPNCAMPRQMRVPPTAFGRHRQAHPRGRPLSCPENRGQNAVGRLPSPVARAPGPATTPRPPSTSGTPNHLARSDATGRHACGRGLRRLRRADALDQPRAPRLGRRPARREAETAIRVRHRPDARQPAENAAPRQSDRAGSDEGR